MMQKTKNVRWVDGCFSTERLQLAIFLHANEELPFIGCESDTSGRIRFAFEDPQGHGPKLELDFERGATVPATAIFASQRFLRREMSSALKKIGEHENDKKEANESRKG